MYLYINIDLIGSLLKNIPWSSYYSCSNWFFKLFFQYSSIKPTCNLFVYFANLKFCNAFGHNFLKVKKIYVLWNFYAFSIWHPHMYQIFWRKLYKRNFIRGILSWCFALVHVKTLCIVSRFETVTDFHKRIYLFASKGFRCVFCFVFKVFKNSLWILFLLLLCLCNFWPKKKWLQKNNQIFNKHLLCVRPCASCSRWFKYN